jgi:hypothetical protein
MEIIQLPLLAAYNSTDEHSTAWSQSQSYFTTGVLPPISSSWRRAPRESRPEYRFSSEHLPSQYLYNILSEERMDLTFTIAAGPRQRIHSRVLVPWDSRLNFTVSDLRLPFCRLLRHAGLRWRYSTLPPHRRRHGPHGKHGFLSSRCVRVFWVLPRFGFTCHKTIPVTAYRDSCEPPQASVKHNSLQ